MLGDHSKYTWQGKVRKSELIYLGEEGYESIANILGRGMLGYIT